jgi:hypothetical protein
MCLFPKANGYIVGAAMLAAASSLSAFSFAFFLSRGKPLTTSQLLKSCYCTVPIFGEKFQSWHRTNVCRAADQVAVRLGQSDGSLSKPRSRWVSLSLVTLEPNSSFNFQARLATVGASFNTYGKRKKCPEALLNFCCSHMLLYKAINLRIFKEPSAFESPISSGMRTM